MTLCLSPIGGVFVQDARLQDQSGGKTSDLDKQGNVRADNLYQARVHT